MLNKISNLGKILNRKDKLSIHGGKQRCALDSECGPTQCCTKGRGFNFCAPLTSFYCIN